MSIKATVDGIDYELETEADVRAFRAAFKSGKSPTTSEPETLIQRLRQFFERVSRHEKQKAFIAALTESKAGHTDIELCRILGLPGNNVLGGVVANVSKNAYAVRLNPDQVFVKKILKGARPAKYHYQITPDLRDLVGGTDKAT